MTDVSNRSGGADFHANEVDVGGDVVGRDINTYNYYGAAGPTTRKAELPPRRPFFGREDELVQVANALKPTARTWGVVIDGAGGIGKTALAIESAYRAPAADFDTKIFLSAKTRELTMSGERSRADFALTDYLSTLNELASALGQGELAKLAPDKRPREVRRALENRKALLILDNLETFDKAERDRLFQFLEELPNSCKVIITSRRRDDVSAKSIRLSQLPEDAALKLIDVMAQNNDWLRRTSLADRRLLHQTASGNPLLIKWIAGQLGNPRSHCRTVTQACDYLKSAPHDNDPLEFILGDLRETFSNEDIAVLAVLTHFAELTSASIIAKLADVRDDIAETVLDALTDRSLLVADAERRSFVLLPVTVTYLRRFLPSASVDQSAQRLMDRVEKLAEDKGYDNYDGFKVLETEWPTIAAALPLFVQGDNAGVQAICAALRTFLNFTGRWDDWLSLSLQAEEKAVSAQDWLSAGRRTFDAGWVYALRQQAAEVLSCAARAENHWISGKVDAYEKSQALQLRGLGHRLEKNYSSALVAYHEALTLQRGLSADSEDVAIVLNDIASVERLSGDYAAAEHDYREALQIDNKINHREGAAVRLGNLAGLALARQDWRSAEQRAREALPLADAVGSQHLIAILSLHLAKALLQQGRKAEGLPYAQRAVEILAKLRSPNLADAQAALKECGG
jgi:tetratricopeptide (TPR) repeat protein